MVQYLPVCIWVKMSVFKSLDWVLCHIRPLSFERQLFKESWIRLFNDVHLLFHIVSKVLIGLILDYKALEFSGRMSFRSFSLLSEQVFHLTPEIIYFLFVCHPLQVARWLLESVIVSRVFCSAWTQFSIIVPQIFVDHHLLKCEYLECRINHLTKKWKLISVSLINKLINF